MTLGTVLTYGLASLTIERELKCRPVTKTGSYSFDLKVEAAVFLIKFVVAFPIPLVLHHDDWMHAYCLAGWQQLYMSIFRSCLAQLLAPSALSLYNIVTL